MSEWFCCDTNQSSLAAESMVLTTMLYFLPLKMFFFFFPKQYLLQAESHRTHFEKGIPRIKTTSIAAAQAEDINDTMI